MVKQNTSALITYLLYCHKVNFIKCPEILKVDEKYIQGRG